VHGEIVSEKGRRLSLFGRVLDELVEDIHEYREARRHTSRGPLRTRGGSLAAPRGALGTPGGFPRRPGRPVPIPRRPLTLRRGDLVALRRDFAGLPRGRLAPRVLLVGARDPPRVPRHRVATSIGAPATSSDSLVPSRGPVAVSRRPLVTPRVSVSPPRQPFRARRGHVPIATRHLGTTAACHPTVRRPEGPHRFHSGVPRLAHEDNSLLRVATAYFTRSETIWLQSPPPVMVSTWTRK
jgi:hypothetical protein